MSEAKTGINPHLKPYMTSLRDVPKVGGLKAKDGWVNMQVQFLIDQKTANSDKLLVGWTVLPPGAQHDRHRHFKRHRRHDQRPQQRTVARLIDPDDDRRVRHHDPDEENETADERR